LANKIKGVKSTAKKAVTISKNDESLLMKSLEAMKDIKKKISSAEAAKTKLKSDVAKLKTKVAKKVPAKKVVKKTIVKKKTPVKKVASKKTTVKKVTKKKTAVKKSAVKKRAGTKKVTA